MTSCLSGTCRSPYHLHLRRESLLTFDVVSTDAELDFSVLRLADCCAPAAAFFFRCRAFSELSLGLGIAVVTMSIGSSTAAGGEQAHAVHKASVTSCSDTRILYDGADLGRRLRRRAALRGRLHRRHVLGGL